MPTVEIQTLTDTGDMRGSSFPVPEPWVQFLPSAADIHVTSLRPGHTRGNHYHKTRKEIILVLHADSWIFYWDYGRTSTVHDRTFTGTGAVLLLVEPGAAHAIVNSGKRELFTLGLTDGRYDPEDTVRVEITRSNRQAGSVEQR